jgi:hypothetical protein
MKEKKSFSTFPTVDKVFLDALKERFPDTCPMGNALEDFYRRQGEQTVVQFLEHQFKQQNLNLLEN